MSPSPLNLDSKNVSERRLEILQLIQLGVTSNLKCTEEKTVGAVWNSGAIKKGGTLHINDVDREAFHAQVQVLWSKEEQNRQLDIVIKRERKRLIRKNYSPLTLRGTEVLLEMEPTTLSLGTEPLLMLVEASTRSIVSNGDPKIILHI